LLQHMLGLDDGVTDALFKFTRPLTGGYYWCPPMVDGKLDLSRLGF
jgi:putative iron-dependent peroxidase